MLVVHSDVASRPKPGEVVCGDQVRIVYGSQRCLVAVADGLGHGSHAAKAAERAVDYVVAHPDDNLEDLLRRTDHQMMGTRGAVLTVLRFDMATHTLLHSGVGNVTVVASSAQSIQPINAPGYLGGRIRKLLITRHIVTAGDVFAVCTDGISSRFSLAQYGTRDTNIAFIVLATHAKDHDDATCVILRVEAA